MSSNLKVKGLKIQNSPQFHMIFNGCQGVLIDKLSISSPKLSPNTDGIHVENSKYVGIYNSMISNGNDYIAMFTYPVWYIGSTFHYFLLMPDMFT